MASVEVINESGMQGFSTREVAKRLGISEGTIFKHFRTKSELMLAILDHYSQYDADIIESIKLKKLKPVEAIMYFINSYAEYYQNYPQITVITQAYGVLSCDPQLADKVKQIFISRSDFVGALISEAQKSGQISQKIDSEMLSDIIWGSFRNICLKWRLGGYGFPLKEYTLNTLTTILDAFINKI